MGDEPIGDSFRIKGEVTKVDLGALPDAPQLKFVVSVDKKDVEVFGYAEIPCLLCDQESATDARNKKKSKRYDNLGFIYPFHTDLS